MRASLIAAARATARSAVVKNAVAKTTVAKKTAVQVNKSANVNKSTTKDVDADTTIAAPRQARGRPKITAEPRRSGDGRVDRFPPNVGDQCTGLNLPDRPYIVPYLAAKDFVPSPDPNHVSDEAVLRRMEGIPENDIPFSRSDVTSTQLCDDLLQYLGPSLEKHKGCILIDLNPGACLWSTKIHNFLQPTRHYLVESDPGFVDRFVRPLVEQSGSKYSHIDRPITSLTLDDTLSELVDTENILGPEPPFASGDPTGREVNPGILVIGNFSRRGQKLGRTPKELGRLGVLTTYSYVKDAARNFNIHGRGVVRALFWLPETEKSLLFHPMVHKVSTMSARVSTLAKITEVAGVTSLSAFQRRRTDIRREQRVPYLEHYRLWQVEGRMRKAGMAVPDGRRLLLANAAGFPDNVRLPLPFDSLPETLNEIESLTQDCETALQIQRDYAQVNAKLGRLPGGVPQFAYPALLQLIMYASDNEKRMLGMSFRTAYDIDIYLRQLRLEASIFAYEQRTGEKLDAFRARIEKMGPMFERSMAYRGSSHLRHLTRHLLAFQATITESPVLGRDQRDCESLKAEAQEFTPSRSPMFLVDVVPKPVDLSIPGFATQNEGLHVMSELIPYLLNFRGSKVPEVLDYFAVCAGRDLPPMVPDLSDPRKGGRLLPRDMYCAMLNDELIIKLVKAIFEWPFAPPQWQLALGKHERFVQDKED